jgi:hypothetical protein
MAAVVVNCPPLGGALTARRPHQQINLAFAAGDATMNMPHHPDLTMRVAGVAPWHGLDKSAAILVLAGTLAPSNRSPCPA